MSWFCIEARSKKKPDTLSGASKSCLCAESKGVQIVHNSSQEHPSIPRESQVRIVSDISAFPQRSRTIRLRSSRRDRDSLRSGCPLLLRMVRRIADALSRATLHSLSNRHLTAHKTSATVSLLPSNLYRCNFPGSNVSRYALTRVSSHESSALSFQCWPSVA